MQVNSHEAADVAVTGQHNRMAGRKQCRQSGRQTLAECIEPPERGRAAPGHKHCDRHAGLGEIEPPEQRLDLRRHG